MTEDYNPEHAAPKTHPLLSNLSYDRLKPTTTMVMPAVVTLWLALANIWDWPNAEEVGASLGAFNIFLGVVLAVATKTYNKSDEKYDGQIDVFEKEDGTQAAALTLHNYENPADVVLQNEVLFKVNSKDG